MFGKKETPEEKAAKKFANKLADETPEDEQVDLYAQTPQLGTFGAIPSGAIPSAGPGGPLPESSKRKA